MMASRWRVGRDNVTALQIVVLLLGGALGCGGGGGYSAGLTADAAASPNNADASVAPQSADAAAPTGAPEGGACPAPAAVAVDLCQALPTGTMTACSYDSAGLPSQTGYLEVRGPDGSRTYVCATAWDPAASGGYLFTNLDRFMTDPQSCCGATPTPAAAPTAAPPVIGYLGAPHAPTHIKPQETVQPGAGLIRQNPFAVILRDGSGGTAYSAAFSDWQAWSGDGRPHAAPDGTGAYYFSAQLLVNYTIVDTPDGAPVAVVGPEVSLTADGAVPLGHPTLGACAAGGGAPLVLIAGEIFGTTLTNHSGRFGHDPSGTREALADAAALFNCFGIPIAATTYYAPAP
jgi:hypothetical protein